MEKDQIMKHLNNGIEKQVPDVWDDIQGKIERMDETGNRKLVVLPSAATVQNKRRTLVKRFSAMAAAGLIAVSTLTFTPAMAAIQELYDKIFSSEHIDDSGLKNALGEGIGQTINQTYYDKEHDISVHFQNVITDDKETKLLLTYESKKTRLENYSIDIFEGESSIHLVDSGGQKKLKNVGWGSRYYDEKENKVFQALSFDSIKGQEGQNVSLEIQNLTEYNQKNDGSSPWIKVETVWPLNFKLNSEAVTERETVAINKEFEFKGQTYQVKQVEFSKLETRVVVTGKHIKLLTAEDGMKYRVVHELQRQYLNSKKFQKGYGYIVDENKSGVFLKSAGEQVEPIFNKDEVEGEENEYIMTFAPVKDRTDCVLEVGDDLKIELNK